MDDRLIFAEPEADYGTAALCAACDPPIELLRPSPQNHAVILASPHSGRCYPAAFLARSRLSPDTLRMAEDAFVDRLYRPLVADGVPMLHALFPRALLDPNRAPDEIDAEMFEPAPAAGDAQDSRRVAVGLGAIPRRIGDGLDIYPGKIPLTDAQDRLDQFYHPYHRALDRLVAETAERFGHCLLIDCHSMPSRVARFPGGRPIDVALGDRHGTSCAPMLLDAATEALTAEGLRVAHNQPYAGGFTTARHGRPERGQHALQIELNRALYMHESPVAADDRAIVALGEMLRRMVLSLSDRLERLYG